MRTLSVVIPSRNVANLQACVDAVRRCEDDARIIVVDDGIDWNQWECRGLIVADLGQRNIEVVTGAQPFVFARNANIGMKHAFNDDIVLLNDDALLTRDDGFSAMQRAAEDHWNYGIISSTTNVANNPQQQRRLQYPENMPLRRCPTTPGHSFATIAFVAVLIPWRTRAIVGALDERYTAYGWEDTDYCRRVARCGLDVGIHDGCFVDHASLQSTFRGGPRAPGSIEEGRRIYIEKWGSL